MIKFALLAAASLVSLAVAPTAAAQDAGKPPIYIIADNSQVCSGRVAENMARQNIRRARADVAFERARGVDARLIVINPGHQVASLGVNGVGAPSAPVYSLHC